MEQKRGGARLRQWLKDHGHKQATFAAEIGESQQNVSRWILGHPVPLHVAVAIRKVTDIPVEDWLVAADSSPNLDATGS